MLLAHLYQIALLLKSVVQPFVVACEPHCVAFRAEAEVGAEQDVLAQDFVAAFFGGDGADVFRHCWNFVGRRLCGGVGGKQGEGFHGISI